MANQTVVAGQTLIPKTGIRRCWLNFKRDWQLHLMVLIPFIYLAIFHYGPIGGLQIALKNFSPRRGIAGSEWVGLANWKDFFGYYQWSNLVINTLAISLYGIFVSFPIPIILALVLHVNTHKVLTKVTQNISYMPHFISLVVMIGILNTVLNPVTGFLGYINRAFGNLAYEDIRASKTAFRPLFILSGVWQGAGWGTILYVSTLSSVPEELHEAAKLDGATRLRRVWNVDIPTLMPIIALQLIFQFGGLLSVGYEKAFLMQNQRNIDVSELISTYVYKQGIRNGNPSFGSAVGLLNNAINTVLIIIVNAITNALTDNEMGLF